MRDKKKKPQKKILRIQDLRPMKDAKGGYPPGPCGPNSHSPKPHIPPGPPI